MMNLKRFAHFFDYLKHDPSIIAFAFFVYMGSAFGQTFFIGIFAGDIREAFNLSHSSFGSIYSLATLTSALVILWTARGIDKVPLKLWVSLLMTLLASACLLLWAAQHIIILFLAIFLLRQAGQGLMSEMSLVTLGRYLSKGRGQAVATSTFGLPVAESFFPIIAVILISTVGWRNSWLIFAIILMLVWLPIALLLLRKHNIRHNIYLQQHQQTGAGETSDKKEESAHNSNADNKQIHYTVKQMLRDYRFYFLLPPILISTVLATGVFFHQVHISTQRPWSMVEWASLFPLYALTNVSTAFVFGYFIDKYGAIKMLKWVPIFYFLFCGLLALPNEVLQGFAQNHLLIAILGFIMLGMGSGCNATLNGTLWRELYGSKHLGAIRSVAVFIMVLGSASSPVLFGVLFDEGLSVSAVMLYSLVFIAMAFISTLLLGRFCAKKQ